MPQISACAWCWCSVDGGSNALILPAGKAAAGSGPRTGAAGGAAEQQPLSKSQLKKLKQVQLKKQRREQLSQVGMSPTPTYTLTRAAAAVAHPDRETFDNIISAAYIWTSRLHLQLTAPFVPLPGLVLRHFVLLVKA